MISRRGFFGMLAGLAAAPVLKPILNFFPETQKLTKIYFTKEFIEVLKRNTSPRFHPEYPPGTNFTIYQCGIGEMGTLYWSKNDQTTL